MPRREKSLDTRIKELDGKIDRIGTTGYFHGSDAKRLLAEMMGIIHELKTFAKSADETADLALRRPYAE